MKEADWSSAQLGGHEREKRDWECLDAVIWKKEISLQSGEVACLFLK